MDNTLKACNAMPKPGSTVFLWLLALNSWSFQLLKVLAAPSRAQTGGPGRPVVPELPSPTDGN